MEATSRRTVNGWASALAILLLSTQICLSASHAVMLSGRSDSASLAKISYAGGVEMRVLPIGDSITLGYRSTDAGGYRSRLYALLSNTFSNPIHFVGKLSDGSFAQPHHEGHSGYVIQQIQNASQYGIYQAPNIVLLHAGTNDLSHGTTPDTPANAPTHLVNLIRNITSIAPSTTVFVCKIIPSNSTTTGPKVEKFNQQISTTVYPQFAGKKVVLVDMFTGFSKSLLADNLHPNDAGYQEMAKRWFSALKANESLIVKPGTARAPPF